MYLFIYLKSPAVILSSDSPQPIDLLPAYLFIYVSMYLCIYVYIYILFRFETTYNVVEKTASQRMEGKHWPALELPLANLVLAHQTPCQPCQPHKSPRP